MIFVLVLCAGVVLAQARTTPVEVQNTPNVSVTNSPTVKIDGTTNAVKALQEGAWTVGISGNPPVTAYQGGLWNVTVAGNPIVKFEPNNNTVKLDSSYNTVRFDPTNNLVKIAPEGNTVSTQPTSIIFPLHWDEFMIANNSQWGKSFMTTGYREARVMIKSTVASANLRAEIWFGDDYSYGSGTPAADILLGTVNFATPSQPLITGANFTPPTTGGGLCAFIVPAMGTRMTIVIRNTTGGPINIEGQSCVYLIN